jgi:AcrR family transcriptional regulator
MSEELGLRERKKLRTRELIAGTARRLFAQHGFDSVTVAEIAREAEVAEKTVYNYFSAKEDLFYHRHETFEAEMLAAVRGRPARETVIEAFKRFLLAPSGIFAKLDAGEAREAQEQLRTVTWIITNSPALLAREEQVFARYTQSLAALLAEETGSQPEDVEPWITANALIGIHRALIEFVRRRTLAGDDDRTRLSRDLRAQARKAFARLENGLGENAQAGRHAQTQATRE